MYNRLVEIENKYDKPSARSKSSMLVNNDRYIDLGKNNENTQSFDTGHKIVSSSSRNNIIPEEESQGKIS